MSGTVGIALVSHSAELARGLAELVRQMAPDVPVAPVGGDSAGGLGTDFDAVLGALGEADTGSGVVVLYDLGSARMTAELAVESLATPGASATLVDAPLVEGAVAAAVAAQGGAEPAAVADAARAAGAESEPPAPSPPETAEPEWTDSAVFTLRNDVGLHARPAALLARSVSDLDARVEVGFHGTRADAGSVLALMSLGARQHDEIEVHAGGSERDEALRRVRRLVEGNFEDSAR